MKLIHIVFHITLLLFISIPCSSQTTKSSFNALKSLYELEPFERAVCCIKFYEGMHRKKDYPYVGYGHKVLPGESYTSEMTEMQAEQLLRKDLKELCRRFSTYGKDSLLLATLAYNVGIYKIIGNENHPKSKLLRALELKKRNFQREYIEFCHWSGRKIPSIERRRYAELLLLYNP